MRSVGNAQNKKIQKSFKKIKKYPNRTQKMQCFFKKSAKIALLA